MNWLIERVSKQNQTLHVQQYCIETQQHHIEQKDTLIAGHTQELNTRQLKIERLTHEIATLKRLRFSTKAEAFKEAGQLSLMGEARDEDLAAVSAALALEQAQLDRAAARKQAAPKRIALPAELPRTDIAHDPADLHCPCGCALKRIGEDVSEKLHYRKRQPTPRIELN